MVMVGAAEMLAGRQNAANPQLNQRPNVLQASITDFKCFCPSTQVPVVLKLAGARIVFNPQRAENTARCELGDNSRSEHRTLLISPRCSTGGLCLRPKNWWGRFQRGRTEVEP